VVPWADLVRQIEPHAPQGRRGRPPFAVETMLRIHFMQHWFALSDPRMEDALHDTPVMREFAGLGGRSDRLPDETTILRFRHLLDRHGLAAGILGKVNQVLSQKGLMVRAGTVVDATLIAVPGSARNPSGGRATAPDQAGRREPGNSGPKARHLAEPSAEVVHQVQGAAFLVNDLVNAARSQEAGA
jgi:transposase, IS5 family